MAILSSRHFGIYANSSNNLLMSFETFYCRDSDTVNSSFPDFLCSGVVSDKIPKSFS